MGVVKEKRYSGDKRTWVIGLDLWGWALPILIEADYGAFRIRMLCFFISVEWD